MRTQIVAITVLAILLTALMPAEVLAHHLLSFGADKALYVSGQQLVTFTIKNNGQDNVHISCGGIYVYPVDPNNPNAPFVAYEVAWGTCTKSSYTVSSGQTHSWQWNQQYRNTGTANDGKQVPDGTYIGYIEAYDDSNALRTYWTSKFNIEKDSDGDGIVDSADIDRDGDGIANINDKCPDQKPTKDSDGDGCNDAAPPPPPAKDSDGDGVSDDKDPCPNDAKDSCADGDPDKDGIKNFDDECDSESGSKETNGCPDSDADGIADKDDKCATQKEDKNGFRDDDGCPDAADKAAKDKLLLLASGAAAAAVLLFWAAAATAIANPILSGFLVILAIGASALAAWFTYLASQI